ncbi:hypothetical protein EV426DRAFT_605056 [Tirmania nivea]|nr:hypothetical protein EV426DRAFT_605056 [Tirmania nivea]
MRFCVVNLLGCLIISHMIIQTDRQTFIHAYSPYVYISCRGVILYFGCCFLVPHGSGVTFYNPRSILLIKEWTRSSSLGVTDVQS